MKLIGVERSNFSTADGKAITGCNVYIARDIAPTKGKGQAVERIYISDAKAEKMEIDLTASVGKEIQAYYNKYGKVDQIVLA